MSKPDELLEQALTSVITRLPGAAAAALALVIYVGAGLALPLALRWSVMGLVIANIVATFIAVLVALCWLAGQVEESRRRQLVEWTTDLRLLSAEEFEWLVGELFRREGWDVQETGRQDGPDGNIDLELTRDGHHAIVQCKRWTSRLVNVDEVRNFGGTLLREGLAGSSGVFVTLSGFTAQARTEARKIGLTLVDRRDLYTRMEKVRRSEPCPICQTPMTLGRSARGWWLRCVQAGCQGKRDLGTDPGRAVDLLTRQA
jgi:HJR/Mrr/RecB family endonuclease